jgi:hypothetical protein
MNPNTLYYNMPSSASSASSSDKSLAVLIKKAMAKMPMSHNTKKSVDEYYKNAMKEIVLKIKATEKAKKDALKAKEKAAKAAKAKVVAKTTKKTKKHVGGDISVEDKNRLVKLYDDALANVETNTDISYVLFKSNIGAIITRLTIINNREKEIIGIENIAKIRIELDKIQTRDDGLNQEQAGSILDLLAPILNKL